MRKTDTPITFIPPPAQHAGKAPCARDQACRDSHRALPFGSRRIGRHLAQRRLRVIAGALREAGKQATLDLFKKGSKAEDSRRAIELINQADIVSETSFPDDTPETFQEAVELAKEYNPDMAFCLAIAPWPYADLYPQLKDHIAVKDTLRKVNATRRDLEAQAGAEPRNFAPIP